MKSTIFTIKAKIIIAVLVPIIGMISFSVMSAIDQRNILLEGRKEHVHQIVEAGISILSHYQALAQNGQMSDTDARERAKADIRDIRYGKGDYLFIYRSDGVTEVLGVAPQFEGKQRIDTADPSGVPFVKLLIEAAHRGDGFVAYSFPRKAGEPAAPKISTALFFKPWDMVVASGVYIDDISAAFQRQLIRLGIILAVSVLVIFGISFALVRSITGPLSLITTLMERLAYGDKSIAVPFADKRDEIGKLARALDVFRRQALELEQQTEAQRQADARNAELMATERRSIAAEFEARVTDMITGSFTSSTGMHDTAKIMSDVADRSLLQAGSVAAAAEEATSNVQTVAAASEELYASISEISRQVAESARISSDASEETKRINGMMSDLANSASRIGEVVKLVNDIASQTNLLALNATIEAARAGDAGKGFTVVAGEVKTLAAQTARATEEITSQITSVQNETRRAVDAIRNIGSVIEQVKQISSGIASAVEEQGAATQEIARNVSQAAAGTNEVSANVGGLTQAAGTTKSIAEKVLTVASEQARYAETIRAEISNFLVKMRS
jgi:methyl-accepting chemotaxis protein